MDELGKKRFLEDAYDSAYKFARRIYEEFPGTIKAVVLFGSVIKGNIKEGSDIDILVIFDDTKLTPKRRFIDFYNSKVFELIKEINPKLHVNTVTLSTFWDNVRIGEPVSINVLRYGLPLIDTGFVEPLQLLLKQGKIRPTPEAIYNCIERVPGHLTRAKSRMLATVIDYYWVVLDAAHAALMAYGKVPPSPEHVYSMLVDTFVKPGIIKQKHANYFRELWESAKSIVHGDLLQISGADLDNYNDMAEEFSNLMRELIKKKKLTV